MVTERWGSLANRDAAVKYGRILAAYFSGLPMKMGFRKATESDTDALIELSRRTINASYRAFLGDEAVDSFIGSGACDRYVEDNIEYSWVILLDDRIIGYSVYKDNLIDLMMIDHDYHRRGYGGRLLAHCEKELFPIYDELTLESFGENENANRFYRSNGWTEVKRYIDDTGFRKIIFRKQKV